MYIGGRKGRSSNTGNLEGVSWPRGPRGRDGVVMDEDIVDLRFYEI